MKIENVLADNLKRLREEKGFTQETFGVALEVEGHTVQNWEALRAVPKLKNLGAIAAALGVKPYELFMDPSEKRAYEFRLQLAVKEYEKYLTWYSQMQGEIERMEGKLEAQKTLPYYDITQALALADASALEDIRKRLRLSPAGEQSNSESPAAAAKGRRRG